MSQPQPSARKRMMTWAREALAKEEERFGYVRAPVLARLGQQELAKDEEFLRTFWEEAGYESVYACLNGLIRASRYTGPVLTEREIAPDGEEPEAGSKTARRSVFETWKEHAGDRHYPLLQMDKKLLLIAADERQEDNIVGLTRERFIRKLAAGLGEDEMVGDRFTTEQLEKLYREIEEKTRKGWK